MLTGKGKSFDELINISVGKKPNENKTDNKKWVLL
jgi:hypothetical protein